MVNQVAQGCQDRERGTHPEGKSHISDLRDATVRQDPLDIVLAKSYHRAHERTKRTGPKKDPMEQRQLEKVGDPHDEIDAHFDHDA